MSTTNTTAAGSALIEQIVEQRQRVLDLRQRHEAEMAREMDRFGELLAATRNDPDPDVNPTSAARAIGVNRNYVFQLVRRHEAGQG